MGAVAVKNAFGWHNQSERRHRGLFMSFNICPSVETALASWLERVMFSTSIFRGVQMPMLDALTRITRQVRRPALTAVVISALVLPGLTAPSLAGGPDNIADVAERV